MLRPLALLYAAWSAWTRGDQMQHPTVAVRHRGAGRLDGGAGGLPRRDLWWQVVELALATAAVVLTRWVDSPDVAFRGTTTLPGIWQCVPCGLLDAGFQVVGTASDGPSAIRRVKATVPDVLVLDLNLPGVHGVEVCAPAGGRRGADPHPPPLGERRTPGRARRGQGGRFGYLVQSAAREEFLEAVRRTAAGRAVFTPGIAGLVPGEFRRMQNAPSPRAHSS